MKERYVDTVMRYPGIILVVLSLFVLLLASGARNLSITNDFRVYFSDDNPQLLAFDAYEATFTPSDNVSLVVVARSGDLFTRRGLELVEELTRESWQIPFSKRVSSISNFQHVTAEGDDINARHLIQKAAELSDAEIAQIKEIALSREQLLKRQLSADGSMTGILTTVHLNRDAGNDAIVVTEFTRGIRDRYQAEYPEFDIYVGGSTTMNTTLAEGVGGDLSRLLPLSYIIIFGGLILLLRSFMGTLAIAVMVSACLLGTFGFFGFVDPVLTPVSGFVPSVLLSIMVADSVHILSSFFQAYRDGSDKEASIKASLHINLLPVTITSATTFIGFLCLNFSDSPPYRALGNMIASGVVLAWIFSLTVLPALIYYFPMGKKQTAERGEAIFELLAKQVIRQRRALMSGFLLLSLLFALFVPGNRIADNWVEYFDDSFEIRRLVNLIDGRLSGVNFLEYVLTSKQEGGINDPEYLRQVEAFAQWYEQQELVVRANRFTDTLKDLNQAMHGDDPKWHRLPESRELAAQYLLFYELSLPQGLGIDDVIDMAKTSTRMTVGINVTGTDRMLELDRRAQAWLKQNAPAIEAVPGTGLGLVFAHISERNIDSLLLGTAAALLLISLLLITVLRSWRYGLISLVPNIIPAMIAYGLWGMLAARIDMALAIVGCATLGIVVDDTVHFLHIYVRARRRLGMDPAKAIRHSFKTVGRALFITSVVLSAGFAILGLSHMYTTVEVGTMMSITILVALVVDFLFLPPLLLYFDKPHG